MSETLISKPNMVKISSHLKISEKLKTFIDSKRYCGVTAFDSVAE